MKNILLVITIFCFASQGKTQENPYSKYGYEPVIATMSNGKFNEFHDRDTIVQIGRVIFNTKAMTVLGFIEYDTLYSEADLSPDIVSRWLSPDPLAAEFPSRSPYEGFASNPIFYTDPDGRAVVPVNKKSSVAFSNAINNRFQNQVGDFLVNSFTQITTNRDVAYGIDDKGFNKAIRKAKLSSADEAFARDLYSTITSEKNNFLDVRTFEDGATQVSIEDGGYYQIEGFSAINGKLPARMPSLLKEFRLETNELQQLNLNGIYTTQDQANNGFDANIERFSFTISLPANPGTVTSGEENQILNGVINGNQGN